MLLKKYKLPEQVEEVAKEMEKKRWYKILKLILWAIAIAMFFFFNSDDIWDGVTNYEASAKDKPMVESITKAVEQGFIKKVDCSRKIIIYFTGKSKPIIKEIEQSL